MSQNMDNKKSSAFIFLFFVKTLEIFFIIFCLLFVFYQCYSCLDEYLSDIISTNQGFSSKNFKLLILKHSELTSINKTNPVEVTVCSDKSYAYDYDKLSEYGIDDYDTDWFGNTQNMTGNEIFNEVTFDLTEIINVNIEI